MFHSIILLVNPTIHCLNLFLYLLFHSYYTSRHVAESLPWTILSDCVISGQCTSWTLSLAAKARQRSLGPMHPSFNITEYLRYGLDEILPENAHELCNGRLHVSMTRVKDGKNVIFTEFSSRDELIQVSTQQI